jgi:hypothetical protein
LGREPVCAPLKQHGIRFISTHFPGHVHYQALREMLASTNKAAKPIERLSSGSFPVLRIVYGSKADIGGSASPNRPRTGLPGVDQAGQCNRTDAFI